MGYFGAVRGAGIVVVVFALASFILPFGVLNEEVKILLTISTFLFAILVGFFMSRLNTRFENIRQSLAHEDATALSIYQAAGSLSKGFQKRIGDILEKYYMVIFDSIGSSKSYKGTYPYYKQLYQEVNKLSKKKNVKSDPSFSDLYDLLVTLEAQRNRSSELMAERLSVGSWMVLITLGVIVTFFIFYLRTDTFLSVIAVILSSVVALVLLIMRDLQNLMMGKHSLAIESGQELFDFMGKLRYYNKYIVATGGTVIPKDLKKYRLGLHKPGEKPNIKVVSKK